VGIILRLEILESRVLPQVTMVEHLHLPKPNIQEPTAQRALPPDASKLVHHKPPQHQEAKAKDKDGGAIELFLEQLHHAQQRHNHPHETGEHGLHHSHPHIHLGETPEVKVQETMEIKTGAETPELLLDMLFLDLQTVSITQSPVLMNSQPETTVRELASEPVLEIHQSENHVRCFEWKPVKMPEKPCQEEHGLVLQKDNNDLASMLGLGMVLQTPLYEERQRNTQGQPQRN